LRVFNRAAAQIVVPALAATATFGLRFTTNNNGDFVFVANTVTTCSKTASECAPAQLGRTKSLVPPVQLPDATMPEPPTDGVAGVVLDVTTQAGIGGATVQLLDMDGNEVTEVTTDDSGAFALANLTLDTHELVVSAQGYAASDPLQVSVPADTGLVVALSPIAPPPDPATNEVSAELTPPSRDTT